ncbi:MAG: GNAT family N-acetyltransferase [Clostridia bacterium]|nr:GNAT family N-acetyltransferase [Clostridia bacterium]
MENEFFLDTDDLFTDEIALRLRKTAPAKPEKRWVPAYYFDICLRDGTKIGSCDLRVGHNEKSYIGGNIGYGIDEAHRGHRYAAKACGLLFKLAEKHGMDHLYITCDPENIASARTCEAAGGRLVEVADIPEDNEMYAEGKRRAAIYLFELNNCPKSIE